MTPLKSTNWALTTCAACDVAVLSSPVLCTDKHVRVLRPFLGPIRSPASKNVSPQEKLTLPHGWTSQTQCLCVKMSRRCDVVVCFFIFYYPTRWPELRPLLRSVHNTRGGEVTSPEIWRGASPYHAVQPTLLCRRTSKHPHRRPTRDENRRYLHFTLSESPPKKKC